MFISFRRIRKSQCARLLAAGLVLLVVLVGWEPLDHHVVSHVYSYAYRYLGSSFDFSSSLLPQLTPEAGSVAGTTTGYPYLIDHPDKCAVGGGGRVKDDVLLLLFVKSSPENAGRRQAVRATWGNESFARSRLGESVRVLFALGAAPSPAHRARVQAKLLREDGAHGDLIQQDFADTFHNLTAKLLLQVSWARRRCPHARFLMSADDDVFVHLPNLLRFLRALLDAPASGTGVWVGHVHRGSPPNRRRSSKYYVPPELYPWPCYPDYTAGGAYVVSADVVARIHRAMLALRPAVYIDDVFMGMCASVAGVYPRDHAYFSGEGKAQDNPCILERAITSHGHSEEDVLALWQAATERARPSSAPGLLGGAYCTAVRALLLCRPHLQNTYSCGAAFA